ncbi:hypothetical protein C8R46DRAFT_1071171 [Mycena filopes]|nr:hypothetical protein C8R46DRAFT_1071171 [Mycena filopes]
MALNDFPPELLTKIFLHLSFKSLLRVLAVCSRWEAIVKTDASLGVKLFKKLSKVYVEVGSIGPDFRYSSKKRRLATSEPVRLHPALDIASYTMGSVDDVYFSGDDEPPRLTNLGIANDFISIPVVTMVRLVIPERLVSANGFKIKVKNPKGVKLIDVFAAMAEDLASSQGGSQGPPPALWDDEPEGPARGPYVSQTSLNQACLTPGMFSYYEGMSDITRTGLGLSAALYLGS